MSETLECVVCRGAGWYAVPFGKYGDSEQKQCDACQGVGGFAVPAPVGAETREGAERDRAVIDMTLAYAAEVARKEHRHGTNGEGIAEALLLERSPRVYAHKKILSAVPASGSASEGTEWEELLRLADVVVGQCDCIDGQTASDSPKAAYRKLRAALAARVPQEGGDK